MIGGLRPLQDFYEVLESIHNDISVREISVVLPGQMYRLPFSNRLIYLTKAINLLKNLTPSHVMSISDRILIYGRPAAKDMKSKKDNRSALRKRYMSEDHIPDLGSGTCKTHRQHVDN